MPSQEELQEVPNYPVLFKHMVLAIFTERKLPRSRPPVSKNKIPVRSSPNKDSFDPTKFNAAMDIALAQLKKYGMISEKSSRAGIFLTSYGRETDNKHKRESNARLKVGRFDKYYAQLYVEDRKRIPKKAIQEPRRPDTAPAEGDRYPETGSVRRTDNPSRSAPTSGEAGVQYSGSLAQQAAPRTGSLSEFSGATNQAPRSTQGK